LIHSLRGRWLRPDPHLISSTWRAVDRTVLALLAAYGVVVLVLLALASHFFLPAEDAVILHQYSFNLARHGAITYYAGGPHAEGATDFAWMLLVAGGLRLGIAPMTLTTAANLCSLLLLARVLLSLANLPKRLFYMLAAVGAAGLMPQIFAAASGFAVLPDALLLAALTLAVIRERAAAAALLAFIFCLFRPDGIVFAGPLLGMLLFGREQRNRRALVLCLLFILPGAAYFFWRAHYFGMLLPLPFLVKADVQRTFGWIVPHSFRWSIKYLLFGGLLVAPLFSKRLLLPLTGKLLVVLVLIPTCFYWSMRLDQDVGDRFFYYLPLAAALLLAMHWPRLAPAQRRWFLRSAAVLWLALLCGPLVREIRTYRDFQFRNVQAIAQALGRLPSRGSLLSTESGFLAYGSGWIAQDAWGLNTARYAKRLIQPGDVVAFRPDLIVMHPDPGEPCVANPAWPAAYTGRTWPHMTRNLLLGAKRAGKYQVWLLSYGSDFYRLREHWNYGEGDRECFLVRRDSPRYAGIVAALQNSHAVSLR
jgi:hypothetical protein